MQHTIITAVKILCLSIAGVVIFKWIERRILLAWMGVKSTGNSTEPIDRLLLRFEKLRTSIWMFAWWKVRLDPQFRELPEILKPLQAPKTILDIGCGHGIVGGAVLEWCPGAKIVGIDPRKVRIQSSSAIFAERGIAIRGSAPDLPLESLPDQCDTILLLDVIHYLDDTALELTLNHLRQRISDTGTIIIRVVIPEAPNRSIFFWIENIELKLRRGRAYYRTAQRVAELLQAAGFMPVTQRMSGTGRELCWFIARPIVPRVSNP